MRASQGEEERRLFQQIRQHHRREPQSIGEILGRLMTRRGYANVQIAADWIEVWSSAAGNLASRTRPGRFYGGVLEVVVDNSATLQELVFRKKHLIATIGQLVPQWKLKDLRFKVGQIQ